ncbi:MAG: hypothetical protein LC624_11270, partial [Halobacteriales archaeon]|nr:hypothetical protein [Halobacteriales archaeon]
MNWRIIIVAALTASMVIPASAMASHFSSYAAMPNEHDDMGSSNEPDRTTTSVLGPLVANHVIDYNNDWVAESDAATPAGKVLAPGCTDSAGRQPSGLCGTWTIGVGTGASGVESIAPRHTAGVESGLGPGLTGAGAITVNFLDAQMALDITSAGTQGANINKKLADSPLAGTLASAGVSDVITPGPSMLWAWYGAWTDSNGNGVIDHLANPTDPDVQGLVYADNEFIWSGQCRAFDGSHPLIDACRVDPKGIDATGAPNDVMNAFIYPGNHHAQCGGFTNSITAGASGAECAY